MGPTSLESILPASSSSSELEELLELSDSDSESTTKSIKRLYYLSSKLSGFR